MNTILDEIFTENNVQSYDVYKHYPSENSMREDEMLNSIVNELGWKLNNEQEFELKDKLKRFANWGLKKAREAVIRTMLGRDLKRDIRENRIEQGVVLTTDANKNNSTIQPPNNLNKNLNEISMMQEIFMEAEDGLSGKVGLFNENYDVREYSIDEKDLKGGHSNNKRPSTKQKHQKADARRGRDQRRNGKGEKGDARRPY